MTLSNSLPLSLESACQILRQFNCLDSKSPELSNSAIPDPAISDPAISDPVIPDRATLQQALLRVAQASDYQILGICADSIAEGRRALESYAAALEYQPVLNTTLLEGAVYIKFNPKTGLCYANTYNGHYRGVLVSCQSAYESGVNEMFGHLPIDLFAA